MPHPFADIGTSILQELGAQSAIVVVRYSGGAWDNSGRFTGNTSIQTATTAVVQPSTPKEMEKLPENERTREGITLFTRSALRSSDVSAQRKADEILWSGRTYEVKLTEDWTTQAQYARSIAVRKDA